MSTFNKNMLFICTKQFLLLLLISDTKFIFISFCNDKLKTLLPIPAGIQSKNLNIIWDRNFIFSIYNTWLYSATETKRLNLRVHNPDTESEDGVDL